MRWIALVTTLLATAAQATLTPITQQYTWSPYSGEALPFYLVPRQVTHYGQAPGNDRVPDYVAVAEWEITDTHHWSSDCDEFAGKVIVVRSGARLIVDCPDPAEPRALVFEAGAIAQPNSFANVGFYGHTIHFKEGSIFYVNQADGYTLRMGGTGVVDPLEDPTMMDFGLIMEGNTFVKGARTGHTVFARHAAIGANESTLTLLEPVTDWRPGDELYLAPRGDVLAQYGGNCGDMTWWKFGSHPCLQGREIEAEVVTILSINGQTVTLDQLTQFAHDENTALHLTRNIIVETQGNPFRADRRDRWHVIALGRPAVEWHGVDCAANLGRTMNGVLNPLFETSTGVWEPVIDETVFRQNTPGRYGCMHAHHAKGSVINVSYSVGRGPLTYVDNAGRHPFVCHASHCRFDKVVAWGGSPMLASESGGEFTRITNSAFSVHGNLTVGPSDNSCLIPAYSGDPQNPGWRVIQPEDLHPDIDPLLSMNYVPQCFAAIASGVWLRTTSTIMDNVIIIGIPAKMAVFAHTVGLPDQMPQLESGNPPEVDTHIAAYNPNNHMPQNMMGVFIDNLLEGVGAAWSISYVNAVQDATNLVMIDTESTGNTVCASMTHSGGLDITDWTCAKSAPPAAVRVNRTVQMVLDLSGAVTIPSPDHVCVGQTPVPCVTP